MMVMMMMWWVHFIRSTRSLAFARISQSTHYSITFKNSIFTPVRVFFHLKKIIFIIMASLSNTERGGLSEILKWEADPRIDDAVVDSWWIVQLLMMLPADSPYRYPKKEGGRGRVTSSLVRGGG